MSAPYREPGGTPCPRCETPLLREHDDELPCGNGCGTWVGNARIRIVPDALRTLSRGAPGGATALPFTRCLVCKLSLNELYRGDRDVLVLGQCLEHGIWIEGADLATFETHYGPAIDAHRREVERVALERERAPVPLPDLVRQLVQRITRLEDRVAELERELKRRGG
jgi:hypothetical protein